MKKTKGRSRTRPPATTHHEHEHDNPGRAGRANRTTTPCRTHDFRFAEIVPNVFRLILPDDAFAEVRASGSVAIYDCKNCNAFLLSPIGRDMPDMEAAT
jgi:hypothetical protein